ncbi:hypothetical protein FKP32DRAFT_101185 [Trametes sanguinea]|nr:hypothetical protein FKP32DRAFT_101185 [Trametes sanguinea]
MRAPRRDYVLNLPFDFGLWATQLFVSQTATVVKPSTVFECRMSMRDCPVELLALVVERVSSDAGLRSLRAVDRTFCTLATPRAFRRAYVTNSLPSALGLKALMECERLANTVETIVFRWSNASQHMEDRAERKATYIALVTVFAQLHKFPALSNVELRFFPGAEPPPLMVDEDGNADFSGHPSEAGLMQSTIMQSLLRNPSLPRLSSLSLANLIGFPFPYYESPSFAAMLSSLEHLHVSLHGMHSLCGPRRAEVWDWMWQETIPIHFLRPPQPHLASLSLTSDAPVGSSPRLDLSGLFFPALRRLELGGIMFDDHRRIEDFIVRHGKTLTTLVLDSCPMYIPPPGEMPTRPWHDVCDRFAEGLEALVDLQIFLRTGWGLDDLKRSDEVRLTYEVSLFAYGHSRGDCGFAVEALDRPAIDNLFTVVRERRKKHAELPPPVVATEEESPRAHLDATETVDQSFTVPIHWV